MIRYEMLFQRALESRHESAYSNLPHTDHVVLYTVLWGIRRKTIILDQRMFEAVLAEVRAMLLDGLTSKLHVR